MIKKNMLILNANDVRRALPMRETIEAMKRAYAALSTGRADIPLRTHLSIPSQDGTTLFMPAYVTDDAGDALTIKIVTLFPENVPAGLPFIHAAVLVMDAETGQTLALLEGGSLTAIRTGAGGGAAADLLARPDSRTAALFGAGVQARTQLEAICAIREIETVWIYAPTTDHIADFITDMQGKVNATLRGATSPHQAIAGADIICAATSSKTPVFEDEGVPPRAHITGVGSYTPDMVEIPPETVARAQVFIDSLAACQAEAGEIIHAVDAGLLQWNHATEIGAVISGQKSGRTSPEQITYYKSVGVAVQDAVAAQLALENAQKMGLGQEVEW